MDENPTSKINLYRDRWTSVKVARATFQTIRELAAKCGVSQAAYLLRLGELLRLVADRHGGDPVAVLEEMARRDSDCS